MWLGQDETVQGLGCPGGTCVGADGHLYEWVDGIDGLGNPVGFWRRVGRGVRRAARRVAPHIRRIVPGLVAPVTQYVTSAIPVSTPVAPAVVPVAPAEAPEGATAEVEPAADGTAGWGLGALGQGPDGQLYEWVQGVDGLGNPVGFWKRLKRLAKAALPLAKRLAPFVPGGAAALTVATPFLRQAGISGYDGIGALYQASDGSVYQVQGIEADDDLNGLADDDELRGLSQDELQGLAADDELSDDGDMQGFADDGDVMGLEDDDELRGLSDDDISGLADEEIQGFEDDDMQGVEGYVRQDGVNGLEAYAPDAPRETPWFKAPASAPPLWSPLW